MTKLEIILFFGFHVNQLGRLGVRLFYATPFFMERGGTYLFSMTLLALVAAPLFKPVYADSFPFSTYPMFSYARVNDQLDLTRAVGVDKKGGEWALHPRLVASEEVVMTAEVLAQTTARGPEASAALCRATAERLTRLDDAFHKQLERVRIGTYRYRSLAFLTHKVPATRIMLHAECEVPR